MSVSCGHSRALERPNSSFEPVNGAPGPEANAPPHGAVESRRAAREKALAPRAGTTWIAIRSDTGNHCDQSGHAVNSGVAVFDGLADSGLDRLALVRR